MEIANNEGGNCYASIKDFVNSIIQGDESWHAADDQNMIDENFEQDLLRVLT
jgi:hypothetical protein